MKVLFVADEDTKYGAAHSLCQLVVSLKKNYNVDITVVMPKYFELANIMEKNGVNVRCVRYAPFYQAVPSNLLLFPVKYIIRLTEYLYGRGTALRCLEKELDIKEFDIVHSNSSREDFGSIIASKYKKPMLWHIREFGDRDYKCFSFRRNYISYMNSCQAQFIAVSDEVKKHWINKGISAEKIIRVYNGVLKNEDTYKQKTEYGNCIRFVIAGNVIKTKGQQYAIELIRRLTNKNFNVQLDIIGKGKTKYVDRLHKSVDKYKLKVNFLGYREDVERILPNYDIGLVCSNDEAFGRVTVEYMMAGLPVLASNTGANTEIIRDNIDGMFYEYGNDEDMERKAISLISKGRDIGGTMTHEYAIKEFSDSVNAEHIYSLYKNILKVK